MFPHEEIIRAMSRVQKKHALTKTELVAEIALAIHVILTLIEPGLTAMAAQCRHCEQEKRLS